VNIEIRNARLEGKDIVSNSVQQNVPAWSLFAIFFIVVSLAGSIIREREGGSFSPFAYHGPVPIRIPVEQSACVYPGALIQFAIMLLMGMYVLPYFGLESLNPGHLSLHCSFWHFPALLPPSGMALPLATSPGPISNPLSLVPYLW
jgi:ABC-2 type transport system permease protein